MSTTLSAALGERKGDNQRWDTLKHRASDASRHQEGENPAETATELLLQAEETRMRQAERIAAINLTNAATRLPGGQTITEALARRDALSDMFKLVSDVAESAAGGGRHSYGWRQSRSEIRDVAGADVVALRRRADVLAQEIRALDAEIQAAGHATNLIE